MYNQKDNNLEGVLASLSPECVDQLCNIIIAKLTGMNPRALASQARRRGFESHHPLHEARQRLAPGRLLLLLYSSHRPEVTGEVPPAKVQDGVAASLAN